MTQRASLLVDRVTIRPVTPVVDLGGAGTTHLPVAVTPPPSARSLFVVADRLVDGMHEAARGKGRYSGSRWAEKIQNHGGAPTVLGVIGFASAMATVFGWADPGPFLLGLGAGASAAIASGIVVDKAAKRGRAAPIPVKAAEPYLEAFKKGDRQTQELVRRLATHGVTTMSTYLLPGEELKNQLQELAAVQIALDPEAARRVESICELARALPRRESEQRSCRAIQNAFEKLDADDRAELSPHVLSYMFRREDLRWKVVDPEGAVALHAALVGRKLLASRDELQKLVAQPPSPREVVPDSGGDV